MTFIQLGRNFRTGKNIKGPYFLTLILDGRVSSEVLLEIRSVSKDWVSFDEFLFC